MERQLKEEMSEINVLKRANASMHKQIEEKDAQIKELNKSKMNLIKDAMQKKLIENLTAEIAIHKQAIILLEERLSIQTVSESHGYY